jgi:ABC-type phosphate/phosphonate transport system substrate-binding protein
VAITEPKAENDRIANRTANEMEPITARLDRTNTSTGYSTVIVMHKACQLNKAAWINIFWKGTTGFETGERLN